MTALVIISLSAVLPVAAAADSAMNRPPPLHPAMALPPWLSDDQLIECATTLSDGLRAGMLRAPAGATRTILMPVLQNDTPLPVPNSDEWVRALFRAVSLRTGARVRMVDSDAPADLRAGAVASRLVILQSAENRRDAVIALCLEEASGPPQSTIAQYLIRGVVAENEDADEPDEVEDTDLGELECELSIAMENGELRFADEDLAEDVHVTVETLEPSEGAAFRIRVRLLALRTSLRTDLQVFFLQEGEVVTSLAAREISLRRGRPKRIDLESELPADRFVLYFSE